MADMPKKRSEDSKTQAPEELKVQDLSLIVERSTHTLQELDERLRNIRGELASAIGKAGLGLGVQPAQGWASPAFGAHQASSGQPSGGPFQPPTGFASSWGYPMAGMGTGFGGPAYGAGSPMGGIGMPTGNFASLRSAGFPSFQTGLGETRSARDFADQVPLNHQPACDIIDEGADFVVQMDMPGVKKEKLDIMATDRAVIVTATARPEVADGVLLLGERSPILYRRTIPLPTEIKTGECKANLKNGVLTLTVPKKNPTAGPKHVDVAFG